MRWGQRKQLFLFQAGGAQLKLLSCTCMLLFGLNRCHTQYLLCSI